MNVDNTKIIKDFLPFCETEWCYTIEIVQRIKDGKCPVKNRILCKMIVYNQDQYDTIINNVKDICNAIHARAYILMNPVIYSQVNNYMCNIEASYRKGLFDTELGAACMIIEGACYVNSHLYYLLDIDPEQFMLKTDIDTWLADNGTAALLKINSVNGEHWIIPYIDDISIFKNKFLNVGLHEECRALLYANINNR